VDALLVTAVVIGLMLVEAALSRRHEARLQARGAVVPSGDVYAWLAVLYPSVFLAMGLEGAWRSIGGGAGGLAAAPTPPYAPGGAWFVAGAGLFLVSKGLKYWAIRSLGDRWTFRVMVLPGAALVGDGPYKYLTHPNYVAVVGELLGAAMMMKARVSGPLGLGLFGLVLRARVRFENRVLDEARQQAAPSSGPSTARP
jgi:methyltransferase